MLPTDVSHRALLGKGTGQAGHLQAAVPSLGIVFYNCPTKHQVPNSLCRFKPNDDKFPILVALFMLRSAH